MSSIFKFKQFDINQDKASLKVGTDAMIFGSLVNFENAKSALDVGTGTGVLALMVAQSHPNLCVDAVEIDPLNCHLAQENFSHSKFVTRLNLIQGDFFKYSFNKKYDLIFSNPPYYINAQKATEVRKADAKHFSEIELDYFVRKSSKLLSDFGQLALIIPSNDFQKWHLNFIAQNLFLIQKISVFGKPNQLKRFVLAYSKTSNILKENSICIRNESGEYTHEYIELTNKYHGTDLSQVQ